MFMVTHIFMIIYLLFISIGIIAQNTLPLCQENEYAIGYWHYNESISQKLHECCANDDPETDKRDICSKFLVTKGFYFNGTRNTGSGSMMRTLSHSCDCDRPTGSYSKVTRRERYQWIPHRCQLKTWDSQLFCKLLGNRRIFLLGDSLIQLAATTIMNMVAYGGGECGEQLLFQHRGYLTFHEHLKVTSLSATVINYNPDIVIITAGAWLHDMGDKLTIISHLKTQIPEIQAHRKEIDILWMSQIVGHYNCSPTEPFQPFRTHKKVDKYGWNEFPLWDSLMYNVSRELGLGWIDMSPLYMRSDAHPGNGDCLHFCTPGPIDLFAHILLHKLYLNNLK